MFHPCTLIATLGTATAALGACTPVPEVTEERGQPMYEGVSTILLDSDLVSLTVVMRGVTDSAQVEAYGRCAAAQYAVDRDIGFARQVRTIVRKDGRTWVGDAVYLLSDSLQAGAQDRGAADVVTECETLGIPTV